MKRVQLIGHEFEEANAFIGDEREITVDITNDELRLHDGSTPGGHKILNRDQNDDRYQGRNTELDGLLDWEPSDRGLVVRLGPGNYELRTIETAAGQLTIENPTGFAGNFKFGLADDITKDIKFSGEIETTEPLKATGGVLGNVTGDLTGDSTGKHTGEVEGDVTGDLQGNTFGTHTGSLDTTDGEIAMAPGQLELAWLSPEIIQYIIAAGLPVGSVVAYAGALEDIPTNWNLCDGTNGTPDLRGRFIIGSNATYPIDSTGGLATRSFTVSLDAGGAHTHSGEAADHALTTAELPAHKHGNGVGDAGTALWFYGSTPGPANTSDSIDNNGNAGTNQGWTSTVGSGEAHSHGLEIDEGGAHSHTGETEESSVLPPYYSLMYIMKGA